MGDRDVDPPGCAVVPLQQSGTYRFSGLGSCTWEALLEWERDAEALVELYIPYDESACV